MWVPSAAAASTSTRRDRPQREPSLWSASLIILIPVLLIVATLVGAHVLSRKLSADAERSAAAVDSGFEKLGVARTRFGEATIGCGGTLTDSCLNQVGLRFAHQTPQLLAYFTPPLAHVLDPDFFDRLARGTAGPPPRGSQWVAFEAPGARWNSVFSL